MMDRPIAQQPDEANDSVEARNSASVADQQSDSRPGNRIKRRIDRPQELGPPVQLPAFRELQKLMSAIADENVDFTEFCTALRDVPQVKKVILRDAHSALSGRVNRIENLKHAVAMLGLNKVRAILAQLAEPYEERQRQEEQEAADEVARVSA